MAKTNQTPIMPEPEARAAGMYADAEVRGRLRLWKAKLAKNYCRIDRLLTSTAHAADAKALCSRGSSVGRQRAFARIAQRLAKAGATLEGARLDGKNPLAVWSILKPRDSVIVDASNPSDAQDCITVNYVLVGSLEAGMFHQADGLWTLEIPDHALGRLLHRSAADPTACILAAHHAALRLRYADVIPDGAAMGQTGPRFLLPSGPGVFVCSLSAGPDVSRDNEPTLHVRVRTWLADDMLRDDQTPLIDDGLPGDRLGDSWLLPAPLRQNVTLDAETGTTVVMRWAPGMPETLASPRGRA